MAITDQQRIQLDIKYTQIAKTERGLSVRTMLEAREEIKAAEGQLWLTNMVYNKTSSFISSLVNWYLWYEDTYGSPAVRDALNEYLGRETVQKMCCVWCFGIKPSKRYEFNSISLVPLEQMPDSKERDRSQVLVHNHESPVAYGAFTKLIQIPRVVSNEEESNKVFKNLISPTMQLLNDVTLLVNGIESLSCLPYWNCIYESPQIHFNLFFPSGAGYVLHDIVGSHSREFCDNHALSLESMINGYQGVASDEKTKDWFKTILERIRDSKRRRGTVNKILDLCIAAEMLLLRDLNERDPISFPFRFRGSWLLGLDYQDRLKIHDSLKVFYGYRCQAAHDGSFKKQTDEKKAREQLPDFYSIVERILGMALLPEYPMSSREWLELILGKEGQKSVNHES